MYDCMNCKDMIYYIEELGKLREKMRWHDAKTDPPKEEGNQLVCWGDNTYGWMRFDFEHGWCSEIDPVYWMPLPEPPKEEK